MQSLIKLRVQLNSVKETLDLAAGIGQALKGGEVIELISDLGGGKTTFVRGLVQGAGSRDPVSSPSFTIRNDYRLATNFQIIHFDFYRLNEPGIIKDMLEEVLHDRSSVVVIEWPGIIGGVLPTDRLTLTLKVSGIDSRIATISCPESFAYLLDKVDTK